MLIRNRQYPMVLVRMIQLLHPEWTVAFIALQLGVSADTVRAISRGQYAVKYPMQLLLESYIHRDEINRLRARWQSRGRFIKRGKRA